MFGVYLMCFSPLSRNLKELSLYLDRFGSYGQLKFLCISGDKAWRRKCAHFIIITKEFLFAKKRPWHWWVPVEVRWGQVEYSVVTVCDQGGQDGGFGGRVPIRSKMLLWQEMTSLVAEEARQNSDSNSFWIVFLRALVPELWAKKRMVIFTNMALALIQMKYVFGCFILPPKL